MIDGKLNIDVKFGYMDDNGKFHEMSPHPIDISDDDTADVIVDLVQNNIFYQGMIAAYEKVLGIDDDCSEEEDL